MRTKYTVNFRNQSCIDPTDPSGSTRMSHFIRSNGKVTTQLFQGAGTLYEILRRGAQVSNNGPCLGYRCAPVQKSTPYTWMKYDEVIRRSEMFAYGLVPAFCQPGQQTYVGIWALNRPEWTIVEHACCAYSMPIVPIYNTFGFDSVKGVLVETALPIIVIDTLEKLEQLIKIRAESDSLKLVILIDDITLQRPSMRAEAEAVNLQLKTFKEILIIGENNKQPIAIVPPKPSHLASISYTSGTGGSARGALLTHSNFAASVSAMSAHKHLFFTTNDVLFSFLNAAHSFERLMEQFLRWITWIPDIEKAISKEYENISAKFLSTTMKRLNDEDVTVLSKKAGNIENSSDKTKNHKRGYCFVIRCKDHHKFDNCDDVNDNSDKEDMLGNKEPNRIYDIEIPATNISWLFDEKAMTLATGGSVGFFQGNVLLLGDDLFQLRPTILPCVPSLLNRVHSNAMTQIEKSKLTQCLFRKAFASKKRLLDQHIICDDTIWDCLLFRKIRNYFGGRVRAVICGSAPCSTETLTFMRIAMGCIIVEGYGCTENTGGGSCTLEGDCEAGHVGPPCPSNKIKLIQVPEVVNMGLLKAGEVCLYGSTVFQGYYKDPVTTAKVIDKDGWYHTGDIGMWTDHGTLKIIGRKNNLFKLSHIFVYGDSNHDHLVAIVIPDFGNLKEVLKPILGPKTESPFEICGHEATVALIQHDMQEKAKAAGLHRVEQVKKISLHPEPFTIDNGLITPTLKLKRMVITKRFESEIVAMYSNT